MEEKPEQRIEPLEFSEPVDELCDLDLDGGADVGSGAVLFPELDDFLPLNDETLSLQDPLSIHNANGDQSTEYSQPENANDDQSTEYSQPENAKDIRRKTKTKTKEYANKASRRSRLKRKKEREHLVERNEALEAEQLKFREQIGTLQSQIQSLKYDRHGVGSIDLKMENLLLRAQVKRHKRFVQHINRMMTTFPEYEFSEEEKAELVHDGVQSVIGQALSLCYTSIADKEWNVDIYRPAQKHFEGSICIYRWQWLPHGSSPAEATRINMRHDLYNLSESTERILREKGLQRAEYFEEHMETLAETISKAKDVYLDKAAGKVLDEVGLQDLEMEFSELSLKSKNSSSNPGQTEAGCNVDDLQVLRILEKHPDHDNIDYVLMLANSKKMVSRQGFPDLPESLAKIQSLNGAKNSFSSDFTEDTDSLSEVENLQEVKATVFVSSLAPSKICKTFRNLEDDDATYSTEGPHFSGMVVRESANGKVIWTGVSTMALSGEHLPWMARQSAAFLSSSGDGESMPFQFKLGFDSTSAWIDKKLKEEEEERRGKIK